MSDSAPWANLAELIVHATTRDPARPYLTYYDDPTGERVELSFKTFGNWVAKTTHLLRSAGADGPGARVAVWLPSHWQTVVVLASAWAMGAIVVMAESLDEVLGQPSDVTVVAEEGLSALLSRRAEAAGLGTVVALSLRPMGGGLSALRAGVVDYADEVLAQPDELAAGGAAADVALLLEGRSLTGRELMDLAVQSASDQQLGPDDRCLAFIGDGPVDDGLILGALSCLVAGTGLVLCLRLPPGDLAARVSNEQVTVLVGPADWLGKAAAERPGPSPTRVRTVVARGDGDVPATLLGAPVTRLVPPPTR